MPTESCSDGEEDDFTNLISKLKTRMVHASDVQTKINILSLLPKSWSIPKICSEFQVSEYLVRRTKKLVKENGILPEANKKKPGYSISRETVHAVLSFYENDEYSRMCPGKKDCVSVRNSDGKKELKQKRLILCNLKELFALF